MALLTGLRLQCTTCFAAPSVQQPAAQAWQELGFSAAPYFLKVRPRPALDKLAAPQCSASEAGSLADHFWAELCGQVRHFYTACPAAPAGVG